MDRPYDKCCFNCKNWTATDDAGVDLSELVASYVGALAERKTAGDANGYNYVLNRLSKIYGTCPICSPPGNPGSCTAPCRKSALSYCVTWEPEA